MKSIEFVCEVTTPMFAKGIDEEIAIRAPAVKGLIRFWWRTINAHLSLKELHQKESEIFGGVATQTQLSPIGKSKIKVFCNNNHVQVECLHKYKMMSSIKYMFYSELLEREKSSKKYIKPGSKFTIKVLYYEEDVLHEFLKALLILQLFGGIGARTRRGAGAIRIIDIKQPYKINNVTMRKYLDMFDLTKTQDIQDYICNIRKEFLSHRLHEASQHYTHLKNVKVYIGSEYQNEEVCLNHMALCYREHRGKVKGEAKALFGLPASYGDNSSIKITAKSCDGYEYARRSSPFIFKVLKIDSNRYIPLIVKLPGEFLPKGFTLKEKSFDEKQIERIYDEFIRKFEGMRAITL